MRRALDHSRLLAALIVIIAVACAGGTKTPTPDVTSTAESQLPTVTVEPECPPEFPDEEISNRYAVQYTNDLHHIFTPIVKGALGQATVSCYLGLEGNRLAETVVKYRLAESPPDDAPAHLRDAFIAAGVPGSQVEMTPYASGGVRSGAVHVMDLRYLGIKGDMDARFLLIGNDVVLSVAALRAPCAGRPEEWGLITPEDGSVEMQIDSALGFALAEALDTELELGCVTSGGIGDSMSLELRYTLEQMPIGDAADGISRLLSEARATLGDESVRTSDSAAWASFSNAEAGAWSISGEVTYADQPGSEKSIIRASLIAESR